VSFIVDGRIIFGRGLTQNSKYLLLMLLLLLDDHNPAVDVGAEIKAGGVFIHMNPRLCHIHTINWQDILPTRSFNVWLNGTDDSADRCQYACTQCGWLICLFKSD